MGGHSYGSRVASLAAAEPDAPYAALVLFSWRRRSPVAARWWLAFWTAALVVFLVHFCWAVWVIFSGDWSRILNTTRVSAPILDTVFAVWWCVDVLIAWLWRSESA